MHTHKYYIHESSFQWLQRRCHGNRHPKTSRKPTKFLKSKHLYPKCSESKRSRIDAVDSFKYTNCDPLDRSSCVTVKIILEQIINRLSILLIEQRLSRWQFFFCLLICRTSTGNIYIIHFSCVIYLLISMRIYCT